MSHHRQHDPAPFLRATTASRDLPLPHMPVINLGLLNDTGPSENSPTQLQGRVGALAEALQKLDPQTEVLEINDDTPSNDEWDVLAAHFKNVKKLYVFTGYDENWVDDRFPLQWPLEVLVIGDACGQLITTPAIQEGRIGHLVIFLAAFLGFKGPTKWVRGGVYDGRDFVPSFKAPDGEPPSRMRTLEILENDAIDTLQRLILTRSHIVLGLERLNIRSMMGQGVDLQETPGRMFLQYLTSMVNLKHFELSLANIFKDDSVGGKEGSAAAHPEYGDVGILAILFTYLPKNLETLKFRGPIELAKAPRFSDWITAFGSDDFLPNLKRLSFVLDVHGTNE